MNASVECPVSVLLPDGLTLCEDGLVRPTWASHDRLLRDYYDDEWGVPVHDEADVFERLALEGFQAGLSWRTVLAKREAFREAFGGFSPDAVAAFTDEDIDRLASNPAIIRNRRKIEASIVNSRIFLEIVKEYGSFDRYIWGFTDGKPVRESCELRTTSPLSGKISEDLKRRGMKFVGSTCIYSTLQAIGVLAAHADECDWSKE